MSMIEPVRNDCVERGSGAGRPPAQRTMEILGELQTASALGRYTVTMPLAQDEHGNVRFQQRARNAAKMMGRKVRVRTVGDGEAAEVTLLGDNK